MGWMVRLKHYVCKEHLTVLHYNVLHPGTRTKICQMPCIVQTKTSHQREEFITQQYGDGQLFMILSGGGEVGGIQVQPPHPTPRIALFVRPFVRNKISAVS